MGRVKGGLDTHHICKSLISESLRLPKLPLPPHPSLPLLTLNLIKFGLPPPYYCSKHFALHRGVLAFSSIQTFTIFHFSLSILFQIQELWYCAHLDYKNVIPPKPLGLSYRTFRSSGCNHRLSIAATAA